MAPTSSSSVSISALQDFSKTLAGRLSEVDSMLSMLKSDPALASSGSVKVPKLGTFADANAEATKYSGLYQQYVQRLQRLRNAITAAQAATTTIINNYHTSEALNAASSNAITQALAGVNGALGGQNNG
jgi:hypothetical protein